MRWEYRGLDDSTGSVDHVSMAVTPVDQVLAVARFGQRAAGVEPVLGVGNCMGAQAALSLAAGLEDCVGTVCILPQVLKPGRIRTLVKGAAKGKPADGGKKSRYAHRVLRSVVGRFGLKVRPPVQAPLPRALERGPVLFLYDREHLEGRARAFPRIRRIVDRLPPGLRSRFELRVLPTHGLDRFGTAESQELTLEAICEWVDRCLDQGEKASSGRHGAGSPVG